MNPALPPEISPGSRYSGRATEAGLSRKDNRFDILRLLAAWLVLFSHCYPLSGRLRDEPLARLLGFSTLGNVGVAVFFVLSGYLVTLSLQRSQTVLEFGRRRALRIFPGLAVVTLLCACVLGPLLTTVPLADYFISPVTWSYLANGSAVLIRFHLPGVFLENPAGRAVNGSLWSIPFEIACYLLLAGLALLPGTLRAKISLAAVLAVGVMAVRLGFPAAVDSRWVRVVDFVHAELVMVFLLGALFAVGRGRIPPMAWPAALGLAAVWFKLVPAGWEVLIFWCSIAVLTLWLALHARWLPRVPPRIGDWSYGAYLYAFPVQQVLAHVRLHEVNFWLYVAVCTVVTFGLAGLSWHLVEKQALRWK